MKKVRRVVTIMLGCVMLLGETLSTNAWYSVTSPPAQKCPRCYNSGEWVTSSGSSQTCLHCDDREYIYVCKTAGHKFYYDQHCGAHLGCDIW